MSWTPSSWRTFPIKQQPAYQDQDKLKKAEEMLHDYPPLIFAGEARRLKEKLAAAGRGETFCCREETVQKVFLTFVQKILKIFLD